MRRLLWSLTLPMSPREVRGLHSPTYPHCRGCWDVITHCRWTLSRCSGMRFFPVQLFQFHQSPSSSGWFLACPSFSSPVGVRLKATLGILLLGKLRTWPGHRNLRFIISSDIFFFMPSLSLYSSNNVCDLSQFCVTLRHSEPLKKHVLYTAVVKPDLSSRGCTAQTSTW